MKKVFLLPLLIVMRNKVNISIIRNVNGLTLSLILSLMKGLTKLTILSTRGETLMTWTSFSFTG